MDLSQEIFSVGAEFTRGADRAVSRRKGDVPTTILPHLKLEGMGAAILDSPLSSSSTSFVRKWGYEKFHEESDSQENLLRRLLQARERLAHLSGFDNFSDRTQKFTLMETSEKVEEFLRGVIDSVAPIAKKETKLLKKEFEVLEPGEEMGVWDLSYLSSHWRNTVYGVHR